MGTRITFVTELMWAEDPNVAQLEADLTKYAETEEGYFEWHKHTRMNGVYFTGILKKYDDSFYEWHIITNVEVRMVWISDERTHGYYGDN